ncbi:MAG: DNA gyrase inhibitor YacG [Myxococcota bacterium]
MTTKAPMCPSCRRAVLARAANPCFPFCSERCRAIDLGRWLGGEYRIVTRSVDEDEDGDSTQAPARAPHDA